MRVPIYNFEHATAYMLDLYYAMRDAQGTWYPDSDVPDAQILALGCKVLYALLKSCHNQVTLSQHWAVGMEAGEWHR